jgi:tetratricopeptide (TPR) repeat protein
VTFTVISRDGDLFDSVSDPGGDVETACPASAGDCLCVAESCRISLCLRRGEELAQQGQLREAYQLLSGVLRPVFESPSSLQILMDLVGRAEPNAATALRLSLKEWVRTALETLESMPSNSASNEDPRELVSRTLAQLYWNQGHSEKALEIYRALLQRDPHDEELLDEFQRRIRALEGIEVEPDGTIRALEEWARRIQQRRQGLALPHDKV